MFWRRLRRIAFCLGNSLLKAALSLLSPQGRPGRKGAAQRLLRLSRPGSAFSLTEERTYAPILLTLNSFTAFRSLP